MKITQSNRDRLVITDFPWGFGLVFGILGGGSIALCLQSARHNEIFAVDVMMYGLVGLSFLLAAAIFTKRSVFTFDLTRQELVWSRISLFGWTGGTVPLGRITGCIVQVLEDRNQIGSSRLALASPDGDIPLTESYSTGSASARLELRRAIHAALSLPPPEPESSVDVDGLIRSMVVGGQYIGAIKLLREHRGISIAEAKDIVDSMKEPQQDG